jgi:autotransporter-associated beta strand protein
LGNTTGGTTVLNGGTLDVGSPNATADNTKNLGTEPITVSGSGYSGMGAIVNNATRQEINAVRTVTLAGNTTFGGNARWDIRGTGANLSTSGNAYNITKIGGAQVSLVGTTVDPALGNIDIQQGTFSIETTTTGAGNPANTITVQSGATLQIFGLTTALNKIIVLNGDGSRGTLSNSSGANVVIGPITLNGPCLINAGGTSLTLSNSVSGSGSLTKTSGGLLSLAGAVNYTGETVVSGGTLALLGTSSIASSSNITLATSGTVIDVSARTDGKLTIGAGKSLIGFGTVRGSLAVSAGGTLSPGNDAITLSIGNLFVTNAVTLAGTNVMQTDKLSGTNDLIAGASSIAFGGRLVVSDVSSIPFADGDMFKLFDAAGYSGSFVIEPASPGTGLYWDQSQLTTSGILKVVSTPPPPTPPSITSVSRSGGNVVISGSGGQPNGNYYVLTATNLATPYSSWTSLVTNAFDSSGNFSFPTPINPSIRQQFYLLKLP